MWCRSAGLGLWALGLLAAALPQPGHAGLGEKPGLGGAAQASAAVSLHKGTLPAQPGQAAVAVHTLKATEGARVREYIGADGLVFAVTWSTRSKPRLDLLLGPYFDSYAGAAHSDQQAQRRPRHAIALEQGDLVVQAQGHAQAFTGRAYLRSRLPAGVSVDALR